ncbi:TetR/AcrR family transcriptional regulator [Streptomyces sp. SBT349]|uniref:TetR/AcrR family transcriptional regulator n=1 Tax=Streptomyces sp. SBT349 TaxID=1580539 RepID=UPI00066DC539|nr:TetR/AcrR family transcriptional regulator [Streptomyces sp. SBT349]
MEAEEQVVPSVWTRPHRARREQPSLSRAQIVTEALRLLDSDGLDALSMRKLGTRLNAGATSMYTHVANKDELIELVVDEVYGEMDVVPPSGPEGWREAAAECAHRLRSVILRHPWMVSVLGEVGLAHLGPNLMRMSEGLLGLFEEAGFTLDEANQAAQTLVSYVTGKATSEAALLVTLARGDQDERQWRKQVRPAAERAARPYPRLRRLYAAQREEDTGTAREDGFDYGLARILDGLQTRLV